MSSVVVFPEVQLLGSDFILVRLSHILLYNAAIYSDSTYEKVGSLENKASQESGYLFGFKALAPQLPITPGRLDPFLFQKRSKQSLNGGFHTRRQ
jgi:hypothetical protein